MESSIGRLRAARDFAFLIWKAMAIRRRLLLLLAVSAAQLVAAVGGRNSTIGFLAELFPATVVLCYKESCEEHRPGGGFWSDAAQQRVTVVDGAQTDADEDRGLLKCMLGGFVEGRAPDNPHKFGPTLSHWRAVQLAAESRARSVLVLEADARDSPAAAYAAQKQPGEWRAALAAMVARGSWDVLRLVANLHPPNEPFKGGCTCSNVTQLGEDGVLPAANMKQIVSRSEPVSPVLCDVRMAQKRKMRKPVPFDRPSGAYGDLANGERHEDVELFDINSECRGMSSAAYAVHSRVFPRFLAALTTVRAMCKDAAPWAPWKANRLQVIDKWLPLWFDNTYVMPPIVRQQKKDLVYASDQLSMHLDADGRWQPLADGSSPNGGQRARRTDYYEAGLGAMIPPHASMYP